MTALRAAGLSPNTARPKRRTPLARALRKYPMRLVIAALIFVEVYPLLWLFLSSFKTRSEFLNEPAWSLPGSITMENYVVAWTTGNIAQGMMNSLLATIPALLLTLVLGVGAGFALQVMVWRGRSLVLLLFVAGIMVPGQLILLPLFTVYFQTGLTGSLWPLIITYTATGLPLTVFMMAAYFRAIPPEVFEASTLDGAGLIRSLWYVGVPMMRNAIFTVGLVQFFFYWNDLLMALTFTNSDALETLQLALLNFTGSHGSIAYGPLFAAICINVFGIFVIFLFLNQRIMRGLAAGAVKG